MNQRENERLEKKNTFYQEKDYHYNTSENRKNIYGTILRHYSKTKQRSKTKKR